YCCRQSFSPRHKEALNMRINRISKPSRMTSVIATLSATALVLAGCSSESGDDAAGDNAGGEGASESYSIGINQLVQHPALDASAASRYSPGLPRRHSAYSH